MGSFADYLEDKLLDHVVGKTSFTMPTCYVGLSTADPLDDASGLAEPSGNGYTRVVTDGADWNAASGGSSSNAETITFPQASGSWGTSTHFALFDAATAGNMLAHGALDESKSVGANDIVKFLADSLNISLN